MYYHKLYYLKARTQITLQLLIKFNTIRIYNILRYGIKIFGIMRL